MVAVAILVGEVELVDISNISRGSNTSDNMQKWTPCKCIAKMVDISNSRRRSSIGSSSNSSRGSSIGSSSNTSRGSSIGRHQ